MKKRLEQWVRALARDEMRKQDRANVAYIERGIGEVWTRITNE